MEKKISRIKYLGLIGGICGGIFIGHIGHTYAATDFMTNWSANSFVPDWYQGKEFPTYGSRINVGFEVIEDGKIADISKIPVRWYVNDDMVSNEAFGNGIKNYSFINQDYGSGTIAVRVVIPDYKGNVIGTTMEIPAKPEELVFDIPYFQRRVDRKDNNIHVWPFFFDITNIDQLLFSWKANGNDIESDKNDPTKLFFSADEKAKSGSLFNFEASVTSKLTSVFDTQKSIGVELK